MWQCNAMRLFALLAMALSVTACGSSSSSGWQPGGSGGASSDGGANDVQESEQSHPADGDSSTGGSALCEAYIACTAETAPAGLDAVVAAYGEGGSCWATTDIALCDKACRSGLIAAFSSFPNAASCNFCLTSGDCPPVLPACDSNARRCVACDSDSDCKASTKPACDAPNHTCVECTSDLHCSSPKPACDTTSHQCLACLDNDQCPIDVPVCDPAMHQCFECASNTDCVNSTKGHKCDTVFTHQCGCGLLGDCGPGRLCEEGVCCTPSCGTAVCGPSQTIGCGSENDYACGVCPNNGTCYQGGCSDLGNSCTPGPGACYAGEACVYKPSAQGYVCLTDIIGDACNNEYSCNVDAHGSGSYVCPAGKCRPYCLTALDCPSGTCEAWGGPVSPATPGVCAVP